MIEVKAYDAKGEAAEAIPVDEAWFGGAVRAGLLREAILMYEANSHQGNASTKTRGEISGSTRKLYRQKHTGRARVGDSKAPQRRGGGSVFGPHPRDLSRALPRKALKAALNSALLAKLLDDEVIVADCAAGDEPKTKPVAEYLSGIGVENGQSCLYVTDETQDVFYRSARNIRGVQIMPLAELNARAVVRPSRVVFSREAFDKLLDQRR